MALTAFETVFILPATQSDDTVHGTIDKYRGVIENAGGTIDDVDIWEPRRLAYPIKKQREGIYVVVNFLANAEAKNELDRIFRISDDVLRHMIIKQDEKADRYPSKARAAEAERRERSITPRVAADADLGEMVLPGDPGETPLPGDPTIPLPDPPDTDDGDDTEIPYVRTIL